MPTEKVMITISGLKDHEVTVESDGQPDKALYEAEPAHVAHGSPSALEFSAIEASRTVAKTSPETAGAAVDRKAPWQQASGDPTSVNFRPDMPLHAKMEWVCENVPKMSRLRILREGAELLCNQLIEKHYRR